MLKLNSKFENLRIILILILVNFLVFYNYWIGRSTPPWDFLGGGQVEQFRFYKDGGFFNPPSWFPYAWFGIPEYQMLQDGGWFIPVALVAEIFYWNPPNAARLQAFLILFGSIGAYFVAKNYVTKSKIALLAAVLYSFIPAFYSNAQHYGVVRSGALLPWIIYIVHPNFVMKNRFSIFFGSLIIFQTIVGSYPGNLISIFYTTLIYVFLIFTSLKINKKIYFKKLFFMSISGLLMGLLRYLPVMFNLNTFPESAGNQAGITFNNLIYLLFPYTDNNLPWGDPSLRSIYIGPLICIAIFFIDLKNKVVRTWGFILLISIIMMMQNQINDVIRKVLPLIDISRFAITDWRNTFNLSLIILTAITIENIYQKRFKINLYRIFIFMFTYFYLIYLAYIYNFSFLKIVFYMFPVIILLLYLIFFVKKIGINPLIIFIICFSYLFFMDNSLSWLTTVKEQYFNIYKKDYSQFVETTKYPLLERPKRYFFVQPPLNSDDYKSDQRYNRFWLTGGFGALGYHNIKDISEYNSLFQRLEIPNDDVIKFLSLESRQIITTDSKKIKNILSDCVNRYSCNPNKDIQVAQLEFNRESEIFKINSNIKFELIQNEMFSPVWSGSICDKFNKCKNIKSYPSLSSLRSWSLPSGEYTLETFAKTPFNRERWIFFYIGLLIAVVNLISNLLSPSRTAIKF